jgi:RNA polymerase-binding transcription factor DksA
VVSEGLEDIVVAPSTRFAPKTQDTLVDLLVTLRAEVTHCVAALRSEAFDALRRCDISDLLDAEDPTPDSDAVTVLMLVQQAEARLWEIEAALGRVVDGTYGYCVGCGDSIPLIRLRALPATVSCIECSRRSSQRMGGSLDRHRLHAGPIRGRSLDELAAPGVGGAP